MPDFFSMLSIVKALAPGRLGWRTRDQANPLEDRSVDFRSGQRRHQSDGPERRISPMLDVEIGLLKPQYP
jgi:hypothetical protein